MDLRLLNVLNQENPISMGGARPRVQLYCGTLKPMISISDLISEGSMSRNYFADVISSYHKYLHSKED